MKLASALVLSSAFTGYFFLFISKLIVPRTRKAPGSFEYCRIISSKVNKPYYSWDKSLRGGLLLG
jgi:hypothetical protein